MPQPASGRIITGAAFVLEVTLGQGCLLGRSALAQTWSAAGRRTDAAPILPRLAV